MTVQLVQLLHLLTVRADKLFQEKLGGAEPTLREYDILAELARRGGQSQIKLVAATGIDRSTVSVLVARMIKRRWLSRRRQNNDKRAYNVVLTDEGKRIAALGDLAAAEASTSMTGNLSRTERDLLRRTLTKVLGR